MKVERCTVVLWIRGVNYNGCQVRVGDVRGDAHVDAGIWVHPVPEERWKMDRKWRDG